MTAQGFFNELQKLIYFQPALPLVMTNCENSDFCNEVYNSKNMFYCFDSYSSSDCFYLFDSFMCANSGDCDYAVESELCYESVDNIKCFNCDYIEYCYTLRDSAYCSDCNNGNNLFGCVGLDNKSYCIFNRQLTEQEYNEQIVRYKALPPDKVLALVEELKQLFPLTQTIGADNENTTYGNYIHSDKNCYMCFDAAYDNDCCYVYDSFHCDNSMDLTYVSNNTSLAYQCNDSDTIFNSNYVVHGKNCGDSSYLFICFNVKNCIGCVGLKNKEYCILNRQFTKEEYEKLAPQVLSMLNQANLDWGNLIYQ